MMRYELIFMGQDHISMRKMAYDAYGGMFGMDAGKFLESNLHLLQSKQFDNRLMGFIFTSGYLQGRYKALKEQLEAIIAIVDAQIE